MIRFFWNDEQGVITVDWVALTGAVLLLGIMVVYAIFNGGVADLVSNMNITLAGVTDNVSLETVTIGGSTISTSTQ